MQNIRIAEKHEEIRIRRPQFSILDMLVIFAVIAVMLVPITHFGISGVAIALAFPLFLSAIKRKSAWRLALSATVAYFGYISFIVQKILA